MKFLVLGGTGYLGSKIVKSLVKKGNNVVCTKREKSSMERLSGYINRIVMIPATADAVETAFIYDKFDWVLNMACNYGRSTVLYDNVIDSNIMFPLAVLNLATEYGIANFMTIGTGLPDHMNMYSFSKGQFSDFGRFYVEKHGINFINMKLEMFYGADEPTDRFLPNCIIRILKNQNVDLTIGTQKRDIVSIHDVVGAILHVLDVGMEGYHEIPVGTGEMPTIREILTFIKEESGSVSQLNFGALPMRQGEPDCVADMTELVRIGYQCKYGWKQGIREMIMEVKKNENID